MSEEEKDDEGIEWDNPDAGLEDQPDEDETEY
jgi:hypothetical protein